MCLQRATNRSPKKEGEGYKVVKMWNASSTWIGQPICTPDQEFPLLLNHWATKEKRRGPDFLKFTALGKGSYPSGFHIWKTLKGAQAYSISEEKIYKAQYRKAHTEGVQNGHKVIVADEIRLLEEARKEVG